MCIATESLTEAYSNCRARFVEAGLLVPLGVNGVYGLSGAFESVIEHFEALVTRHAAHFQADVVRFPPIFNRADYLRTSHMDNFPDLMGSVHSFEGNERQHAQMMARRKEGFDWTDDLVPSDLMLVPAACYPLYPTVAGTLPGEGRIVDLRSFVFRHEPSLDPARMQIFRQREFVRLGTADEALAHRDYWVRTGVEILNSVGLDVVPVVANDPFFGRAGKMMAASQKEQVLKYELTFPIATGEKPTAIASSNCHLNYFGKTFGIHTPNGEEAHTACVGFGLERIALALFTQHGFKLEHWPQEVKQVLAL